MSGTEHFTGQRGLAACEHRVADLQFGWRDIWPRFDDNWPVVEIVYDPQERWDDEVDRSSALVLNLWTGRVLRGHYGRLEDAKLLADHIGCAQRWAARAYTEYTRAMGRPST